MATINIEAERLDSVRPVGWNGLRRLEIECDMTPSQMRAALGEFLKHITCLELAEWIEHYKLEEHFSVKNGA